MRENSDPGSIPSEDVVSIDSFTVIGGLPIDRN
jgi:hypothetical protein